MSENRFTAFRNEGGITLSGKTALFRRVGHSTSNWYQSKKKNTSRANAQDALSSAVTDGAGLAGAGNAIYTIVTVGLAGTATGAAAIIGGPITAIVAGVITLGFLAKGAYSNRDSAHAKLQPYVYSLIDDVPPRNNIFNDNTALEEAAKAAAYLMKEAPSQYKVMGQKLQQRQSKFSQFWQAYSKEISIFVGQKWSNVQSKMDLYERTPPGQRTSEDLLQLIDSHEIVNKAKIKSEEMWERQSKQGGAVFEYMRRLVKLGNYLQCADIVSTATYNSVGMKQITDPGDPFSNWDKATSLRKEIQMMSDVQSEVELNYTKWDAFATKNGVK